MLIVTHRHANVYNLGLLSLVALHREDQADQPIAKAAQTCGFTVLFDVAQVRSYLLVKIFTGGVVECHILQHLE